MSLLKLCFILETGTDVRLVEGLASKFDLTLVGRKLETGLTINHPPNMPVKTVMGPSSKLKYARFVWNYLQEHREFDYVIVQNYGLIALAVNLTALFTKTLTAMLVCSPIEDYYICRKENIIPNSNKPFKWYELFGFQIIARINAIIGQRYIVLSKYLAEVVRSHGTKKPISIIPIYGVDTKIFVPSQSKTEIKAKQGLPTTGSLVFFSSRIAPEKDSQTLLLAFQQLIKEGRDLWLLHRSGGHQTFIQEAKKHGVAERVIATDAVHPYKQLPLDYQACDLCIQSSREEGLGFSPLEALSCRIPVVATAVGGLKETIRDGETGWTYMVGDSDELASCIKTVLDSPNEATRRTDAGHDLVKTKYDRQIVFDRLFDLVKDSVNSNVK